MRPPSSSTPSGGRYRFPHGTPLVLLAAAFWACGGSNPTTPDSLPAQPVLVSPLDGTQVATDTPTFTVRNASGFDSGQASYTFRVAIQANDREIATVTVTAGRGTTSATFATPLLRGATLAWKAIARNASGEVSSGTSTFRLPAVECVRTSDPYAKSVVEWSVPACSLAQNHYNNPLEVLGPPNGGGQGPDSFFGFMSLGEGGHVTVDLEACAVDAAGDDIRVYQTVSNEPVTLYASGSPGGPFVLLDYRKLCGVRTPDIFSNHCDFDLAAAGLEEARYLRIEDGELYPCPGDTVTEGTDIDAVEILHRKP